MYEVLISHEAEKYYKKQDKDTKRRLNKCIDNLRIEPLSGPHLKGCMENLKVNIGIILAVLGLSTRSTPKIKLLK